MNTPLDTILSWFETGDFPTEDQFKDTFLSFYHKDYPIPVENIEGLAEIFRSFASSEALQKHLIDSKAHSGFLALLNGSNLNSSHIANWKSKLGISNAATIDNADQLGNSYTKIQVNGFVDDLKNTDKQLDFEVRKIQEILLSNDTSLDKLQEIVDFIKKNRRDIEALKEIPVGESSEDKVKLLFEYESLGNPKNQQEFNAKISQEVFLLSQSNDSAVVQITGSTVFPNLLETENVIIQARDSITGKKINVDDYASNQNIEINILSEISNPLNILILKVKP